MNTRLIETISGLDEASAMETLRLAIDEGESPSDLIAACNEAMAIVGAKFERNEYYLAELMMAGDLLGQMADIIKPMLGSGDGQAASGPKGRIVIGTVRGDVHNIGKDIVAFMLEANGYTVVDLGVDVPESDFVEAIRKHCPSIVCLSGLLTSIFPVFRSTIDAIKEAGLRDSVKVAIGGGQVDASVMEFAGADGYGSIASAALTLANEWTAQQCIGQQGGSDE